MTSKKTREVVDIMNSGIHIDGITLTGADDSVDPVELAKISKKFRHVEWGILFSSNNCGTGRYPSPEWRREFYRTAPDVARAAHLFGTRILEDFAAGGRDGLHSELREYQRIQLNFNANRLHPAVLHGLVSQWESEAWCDKDGTMQTFITQHNEANAEIYRHFSHHRHIPHFKHEALFDSSGGNGASPSAWERPIPGVRCGYAGGLGTDNLAAELARITEVVASGHRHRHRAHTWVDMESKLRTDDRFDLDKVQAVIETVRSVTIEARSHACLEGKGLWYVGNQIALAA